MDITVVKEDARGCGYRHSGPDGVGVYLMGDGIFEVCERIPFPIGVCPCCGQGTKFSRGFTWIEPQQILNPYTAIPRCADIGTGHNHKACPMCNPPEGRHGLIWIGDKYYSTGAFLQEAMARGISKRVASIPKGFIVGETTIYLAHKKAILRRDPAIFTAYRPSRVDIVVDVTNPEDLPSRAVAIAKRLGDKARIIKVEPVYQQQNLLEGLE